MDTKIQNYISEIQNAEKIYWSSNGYDMTKIPEITVTKAKKFYKIWIKTFGQTSIHCFVDFEGKIYKPATWQAPAKGIRGNVNNDKKPLLCGDFYRYR